MVTTSTASPLKLEGVYETPIYYEDTDFSGYVYHANYLKFMERAREHLLGIDTISDYYQRGYHFVVQKLAIDYLTPAKHGDILQVLSTFALSRSPRVHVQQDINIKNSPNVSLASRAQLQLAFVGPKGVPVRIPNDLLEKFA